MGHIQNKTFKNTNFKIPNELFKTCNGVAVVLIQNFIPDPANPFYKEYFANALAYGCGAAVVIGIATLLSLW
jgi:hypothetical protein